MLSYSDDQTNDSQRENTVINQQQLFQLNLMDPQSRRNYLQGLNKDELIQKIIKMEQQQQKCQDLYNTYESNFILLQENSNKEQKVQTKQVAQKDYQKETKNKQIRQRKVQFKNKQKKEKQEMKDQIQILNYQVQILNQEKQEMKDQIQILNKEKQEMKDQIQILNQEKQEMKDQIQILNKEKQEMKDQILYIMNKLGLKQEQCQMTRMKNDQKREQQNKQ